MSVARTAPLATNSTLATVPSASVALACSVTFAGATNAAPAPGAVRRAVGGLLTLTVTAADVATAPLSSVALAVRLYVPPATLDQRYVHGAAVSVARRVVLWKNSTVFTVPSASVATTAMSTVAGAV